MSSRESSAPRSNLPGYYLRHSAYELRGDPFADNSTHRADASFALASPWS